MKYFTPERYVRLQDLTDEKSVRAAIQEWEDATAEYARHLEKLLPKLPKGLRTFAKSRSLHDAEVLAMWQEGTGRLKIVVQRENDPTHVLLLGYSLTEPPRVDRAALPEPHRTVTPTWLYDEIE